MTEVERWTIVEAVIRSCMWGQGGIAHVILERLEATMPGEPSWLALYDQNAKRVRREAMGVITDDEALCRRLAQGCWLTNWDEDGCSLFNPPPMNGLDAYVSKELADKYRSRSLTQ